MGWEASAGFLAVLRFFGNILQEILLGRPAGRTSMKIGWLQRGAARRGNYSFSFVAAGRGPAVDAVNYVSVSFFTGPRCWTRDKEKRNVRSSQFSRGPNLFVDVGPGSRSGLGDAGPGHIDDNRQ